MKTQNVYLKCLLIVFIGSMGISFANGEGEYIFVDKWGTLGNGDRQFNLPLGIACDSLGFVYVADYNNHRIQKFGKCWYFNDFENCGELLSEWFDTSTGSTPLIDTTPGTPQHAPDRFLGRFWNDEIVLTLNDMPVNSEVTISFDLYVIQTWDGNYSSGSVGPDIWELWANNENLLLSTTFTNYEEPENTRFKQAYP